MPKFDETTTAGGFFRVDDLPYQKGDYIATFNNTNETLEIRPKDSNIKNFSNGILNVEPTGFASWTDSSNVAYASYAALKTAVEGAFFFS